MIETDEEFARLVAKMEELDFKTNRAPQEDALLALLEQLIKDYDDRIELTNVPPV